MNLFVFDVLHACSQMLPMNPHKYHYHRTLCSGLINNRFTLLLSHYYYYYCCCRYRLVLHLMLLCLILLPRPFCRLQQLQNGPVPFLVIAQYAVKDA